MKLSLKGKSFSAMMSLAGAALSCLVLIVFCIYGATYTEYFDLGVVISFLLGIAGAAAYTFIDSRITEYMALAAVLCMSFGLGLFFMNSYPVWADWWGNFDMYGSRGGVTPVITILVIILLAVICNIISCFTRKKGVAE